MGFEVFDNYECEGQMTLDDLFEIEMPERVFAVSKIFARARKQMNTAEYKTFVMALTSVDFTKDMPEVVYMDKKTLAKVVGINSDADHLSVDLFRAVKDLPKSSYLEFKDEDLDVFESGVFITRLTMLKNRVKIKFEKDYLQLFGNLQKDYITMWSADIFQMQNTRTMAFYEDLRMHCDTREEVNSCTLGVKYLKDLFGMSIDDYVVNGHFERSKFEKYVIEPLCKDMENCRMISLIQFKDGKYYEKVKKNGRVLGYKFFYTVTSRPGIVSAKESMELKLDIEKDPQTLKIAKDIADGKKPKSKSKAKKPSGWNDIMTHEGTDEDGKKTYDGFSNDDLETLLLANGNTEEKEKLREKYKNKGLLK